MSRKRRGQRRVEARHEVRLPERAAILEFLAEAARPRTLQHLATFFRLTDERAIDALDKRLAAMLRDGQLLLNRRDGYGLAEKMELVVGRVIGHPDGYGFLVPDDGRGGDLFIPAQEMRQVLHGDRIMARVTRIDRKGRREATIVEVLQRANTRIVGRYRQQGKAGFVAPDNRRIHQDILIPDMDRGGARPGQFVVAEIVTQPSRHNQPLGRVIEVIGDHLAAGMATEVAIRAFQLPHQWSAEVESEIRAFDATTPVPSRGRRDLRSLPLVTIDGEDARDFDDAVYCERQRKGWRLLVAIADVSHYVQPDTALDAAALDRGNSVYFPDRVIPMLPEILSNELCSLKPDVDRLAIVCELEISDKGKVRDARFYEAIIRSAARLTYTVVAAMAVAQDAAARRSHAPIVDHVDDLYHLYGLMHRQRARRGILEFDATESRIEFDDNGQISGVRALVRNDAHRLIEEFMLAANVAAAEFLLQSKLPVLYRNHETPKAEKLADLREFLGEFGLKLEGGEEPQTSDYARLCDQAHGREDAHLITTLILRSMPLAVYGEENLGHFGLAFPAYTHFTSPIRRYPDLLVHRAIRAALGGGKHYSCSKDDMHRFGEHCSTTERRADEATRDCVQRLKCVYMQDRVGEAFNGTITGVTSFGLFVELDDIFVEGLVHITALPSDYYHFDAIRHQLQGERSGARYRLAGRVRVVVARVDVDEKRMDFTPVVEEGEEERKSRGKKRGRGAGRRRRH